MPTESKSWTEETVRIHRTDGAPDAVFFANGIHRLMRISEAKQDEIDEFLGVISGVDNIK